MSEEKIPSEEKIFEEILASYKGEEEMTEKQQAIIKAAMEIIFEKGFAASSTSEIAKKAGVAEATIFKHFKSKDNLLFNLLAPIFIKLIRSVALKEPRRIMASAEKSAQERLNALFLNRLEFATENWPHFKIFIQEALVNPTIQKVFTEIAREILAFGQDSMQQMMDSGQLRRIDTRTAFRVAASMLMGYQIFKILLPEETETIDDKTEVAAMVDIFLNGMANRETDKATARETTQEGTK